MNGLLLILGLAILFSACGHSFGIQNDQITIEKGVWTELMITHQNNGSEVVENNVSLNGRCIQSTINTDNMRILCKDSNASSSEALCYEYQILFRAEKNIEIGLCIYTLRNSGIPKPTNYPQYRIIVIEKTSSSLSSSITSGNIATESSKIVDVCTNTIIPIVATILGVFLGVSLLGNLFLIVYLCKRPQGNIDKGFPRSLMFLVEQISPVTEVQQKLSNTLSRRQVLQEIPVPVANNETTITTNREERVTVSSIANETQQTTGIIFPGVNETERILQGHTLSSPAINNVAVSTI